MPEVLAPVEEVGALVMTLAGTGLQMKRTLGAAPGASQPVITWNDTTGDVTLRTGPEVGAILTLTAGIVVIGGPLNVVGITTFTTAIRLPGNSAAAVQARNVANTAWLDLLYMGAGDIAVIPRALSVASTTITGTATVTTYVDAALGRFTGASFPTAGTGVEVGYNAGRGFMQSVTRPGGAFSPMDISGDGVRLIPGGNTGLALTVANTGVVTVQGLVSNGTISLNAPATAIALINTTNGAVADTQQLHFTRGGATKWRIGNNVTATNIDLFELYDEGVGTAIAVNKDDRMVTFYGGVSIQGGNFSTGTITMSVANGMLIAAQAGSIYDFSVVSPTGANVISIPTGTLDVVFSGNVAIAKNAQATLTIQSAGSNDSYLRFLGTATVKNWRIGKDISNANAWDIQASATNGGVDFASIFVLTNIGNLTLSGSLAAQTIVTVNRGSAASLLGYIGVFRVGTPLYYIGQDGSDRGAILSHDAAFANMWWDDAGNFAIRGSFSIRGVLTTDQASLNFMSGPTSIIFWNSANNTVNMTLTDTGALTVRAGLTITGGGFVVGGGGANITGGVTLPSYGAGGGAITVGAADSGGAGFKVLRVPN